MFKTGLGIDFGSESLKIARVKIKNSRYIVTDFQVIPLSPGVMENNLIKKRENILDILKPIIAEKRMMGLRCVTSVSIPQAIVKNIKLPDMKRKELKEAVKWELAKYLPYPLEQAVFDFKVVNREGENTTTYLSLILIGIQKEIVDGHIQIINNLALKHSAIDFSAFALYRGLNIKKSSEPTEQKGTELLLDMGAVNTRLYFFNQDRLCFQKTISFGGHTLTRDLMSWDNYSWQEAQEWKMKYGIYMKTDEEGNKLRPPFLTSVNNFIQELRRSIDYFNMRYPNNSVKTIILAGGGARIKGILDLLSDQLPVPITLYQFSEQINFTNESIFDERIQSSLAVGLAIRGALGWN
jgi:type IV pilus assembly protein PilM